MIVNIGYLSIYLNYKDSIILVVNNDTWIDILASLTLYSIYPNWYNIRAVNQSHVVIYVTTIWPL